MFRYRQIHRSGEIITAFISKSSSLQIKKRLKTIVALEFIEEINLFYTFLLNSLVEIN